MPRLVHLNLGERVSRALHDLISSQAIPPGSRLSIERLCEDFGVSRTPVWEAVKRLESQGLVEVVPRLGVFVLNFSVEKVHEIFAVREVLEGLAARLAAERGGDKDLRTIEAVFDSHRAAVSQGDVEGFSRTDFEFHNAVLAVAGNALLSRQLEAVYAQILVLRLRTLAVEDRMESGSAELEAILDAILARDPPRAESVARNHTRLVLKDAMRVLREKGLPVEATARSRRGRRLAARAER